MIYRLSELARKTVMSLCLAAVVVGFTASCSDDYDLDDKGNYPSWLGQSIYDELKSPGNTQLSGTFTNYLRLIDDLGYTETLQRTGSKTVFAANDEAFSRFFANNQWGVTKYEDLTEAQKKLLLYSSMLDNAILVEMLSNVSNTATSVSSGIAMRHQTGVNIIDTISHFYGASDLPRNNSYWTKFYNKGIDMVMDATRPMMVHFTADQLTANNITTLGPNSDFAVITGTEYNDSANTAYIFRNLITHPDVTCKNGYIHQMEDVIVPPGNMAELIRTNGESNIFSRMLDRFSAPYYNGVVTNNYNDWAIANGYQLIDSIFEKRYLSSRSKGAALNVDPNGRSLADGELLPYDPGWNQYYPNSTNELSDVGAMFVPTDDAMKAYFLPGGSGSFLIDQFGSKPNTEENLMENVDSIPKDIVQAFISMLMKPQFVASVPSKFDNVLDDSQDPMGITLADLNRTSDNKYDVKIANNGVIYMTNRVFAPNRYVAVSAPALLSDNMRVMNWGIQDQSNLNLNYYAYLLAMDANYAFFIPTDEAFDLYYVDPVYLRRSPRVLHFYYRSDRSPYIFCSSFEYDPTTGVIGRDSTNITVSGNTGFRSQFIDILNTHTVILQPGEKLGSNHYYKTKNGGEIYVSGANVGSTVASGAQINGININGTQSGVIPAAKITRVYNQKNGTTYALDRVIQMPMRSVYATLASENAFSEFFNLCTEDRVQLGLFAGISNRTSSTQPIAPIRQFTTFIDAGGYHGLDQDVSYFSGYNYTVYAPDNEAMNDAYSHGLPSWDDVKKVAEPWYDEETGEYVTDETDACKQAQAKVYAMIETISNFIRYHFQDNAVYADNTVEGGTFNTANTDTLGIAARLTVKDGGNGRFTVQDARNNNIVVSTGNGAIVNQMARDYVFNNVATSATQLLSSSFAVVHEISKPLNPNSNTDRYDGLWSTAAAKRRLIGHQKLGLARLARMYRK